MAVTFLPAAERAASWQRQRVARVGLGDLVLLATSCVVALAIGLAYVGRFAAIGRAERARTDAPRDLSAIERADLLEPGLAAAFSNPADRQFAAREWLRFLTAQRAGGRALPNVGAAARATVSSDSIARNPRLDVFARRLATARDGGAAAGTASVAALPLFTAAELATIKPAFVVRTRAQFRNQVLLWSFLYLVGFHVVAATWRRRAVDGDRLLLAAAHLITGLGFAILLSRPDPLRDVPLFIRYSEGVLVGLGLTTAFSLVDFETAVFRELSYLPLAAAIGLCALLILFGSGPGRSGAKVNLGPVQPIEAIRLLLAFFLAGYFARRWELLRGLRSRTIRRLRLPAWMNVPRGEYVLPLFAGVAAALALFAVQKDLGPALLLSCVFLAMYAVARARLAMPAIGFAVLIAGFYAGHLLHVSRTLSDRVLMWQSPWDNLAPGGDQVVHAIWAMAAGGPAGTGLGLGDSRYLPAGSTDLIFAAVGEELGFGGLIALAAAYAVVGWRGFRTARSAPTDYGFFLATALTLFLVVPALVMAAGVVGAIPLTGVVTPFLSYGGSAMAANFAALGVLSSIHADRRLAADLEPFRLPLRWVGRSLAAAALALAALAIDIQILHADDFLVRPQLGVQADGVRRHAYNPRVLDVARQIPRGTIFDRRGLPLATDDVTVMEGARAEYQKLGISLADVCASATERCYPLAGRAFHVLGDVSRVNWSAPNTSYVERDAEAALRGFDDHATVVQTVDGSGRQVSTLRRDYREIVPLVRHRYEPQHPAVIALRHRSRDVRMTLDAGLQLRIASIVEAQATRASGKAAAVVLDPDTGAVLASVSYPWPSADADDERERDVDPLLDRARYGLYPPGSTFKLVTAAAALDRDLDLARTVFSCARLEDGRIGAKLAGWSRPVRDDVLDTHPHGSIDMHEAVVHSCNAYFAQLAVKLGPQALIDCAARLGIALTPSPKAAARVRDTLPQVGYGQGDVRTTPLRMARAAGAVAASGTLRDARWDQSTAPKTSAFLSPAASQLLAGYLRDVVTSGTGSSLRNHPWRIAGKTGTAEVRGAPSHGWFVGYAPYGPARKRIAFAIVIEHGGYGGRSAAPAAGEIVTAAALSGLIE
jgi:cell division protein FtsW (lipid II flippase)/cell division protein FtsI/penicillin-binding protein 2